MSIVKSVNQKYWPIDQLPPQTQSTVVSFLLWWDTGVNPKQIKSETTGSVRGGRRCSMASKKEVEASLMELFIYITFTL